MRTNLRNGWLVKGAMLALLVGCGATVAGAESRQLTLDASSSSIRFELPATGHDVHGLFQLRSGVIAFDPVAGTASGEIVVDAGSGSSGNGSRDKTMREDVLEVPKFPEIRFVAERFQGELPESGDGNVELAGKIFVHGASHPLTLQAKVQTKGNQVVAETEFPIAFLDWGMKDPSFLFLRVDPVVHVKVSAHGELSSPAGAAGGV
ncbi:MAG: YceI family protein [Thermoanaerobaculia bacterium]